MTPRIWLDNFLNTRNIKKTDGRKALFTFQVKKEEYLSLLQTIKENLKDLDSSYKFIHWSAAFCLYTSEWYRREYNSKWSWDGVEQSLQISLTIQKRSEIVTEGLRFWKRPIRSRGEYGRDLLGSLFLEGGLPWSLIQSGHIFGKLVRKGLREYHKSKQSNISISELLSEDMHYMPHAFQNDESLYLIIGIVENLMNLVSSHPLDKQENPYSYLDNLEPTWRSEFPLPLDESNAQHLINDWLIDANKSHKQYKEISQQLLPIKCSHFQIGELKSLNIKTKINYPRKYKIHPHNKYINSSRFEVILYEGDRAIQHEGIVYGKRQEDKIEISFQKIQSEFMRKNISESLNLRFMNNGEVINKLNLKDSVIDENNPIIFVEKDGDIEYISDTSCSIKESSALLWLPRKAIVESQCKKRKGIGPGFSLWVEIEDNARVIFQNEIYDIKLNTNDEINQITLVGRESLYETKPSLTYLGIPGFFTASNSNSYQFYIDNQVLNNFGNEHLAGIFYISVKDSGGFTVLRKRIGILPKGFHTQLQSEKHGKPAKIIFNGVQNCDIKISSEGITTKAIDLGFENKIIELFPEDKNTPPLFFYVMIKSPTAKYWLSLQFPFPHIGVKLIDTEENIIIANNLSIDALLGHRLIMFSGLAEEHIFYLTMELISSKIKAHPQITNRYEVNQNPITLNLYSMRSDILQLLSITDDQDACVRITISFDANQVLFDKYISRYEGDIESSRGQFHIKALSESKILDQAIPIGMQLKDPCFPGIELKEFTTEGIGTGIFSIPHKMDKDGPWLILPSKDSLIQFRPQLHISGTSGTYKRDVISLHQAVQEFHPKYNADVIDCQVHEMAQDMFHSGWKYMGDLLKNYRHTPLSSFEVWLSISKNKEALAAAVFRLDFNESFCSRISEELSILWECISIDIWHKAFNQFQEWLVSQGMPNLIAESYVSQRLQVMISTVSVLEHIKEYIRNGSIKEIKERLIHVLLPQWFGDLRIIHKDEYWPTYLQYELTEWAQETKISSTEKNLPENKFHNSVVYLPFFMARVTIGQASLEDLEIPLANMKFYIQRLIDFDREWFVYSHSLLVYFLLQFSNKEG